MVVAGAGNETTTRLIGWAGTVLADNPDQRRELVDDPSLIKGAIEELLRFEPPAPHTGRYVAKDVELHGRTVPEGSVMLFLNGSANRDDRKFADPDRFDIHRELTGHMAFGFGVHFCLGAALARLEGRVALEELLARFPDLGRRPGRRRAVADVDGPGLGGAAHRRRLTARTTRGSARRRDRGGAGAVPVGVVPRAAGRLLGPPGPEAMTAARKLSRRSRAAAARHRLETRGRGHCLANTGEHVGLDELMDRSLDIQTDSGFRSFGVGITTIEGSALLFEVERLPRGEPHRLTGIGVTDRRSTPRPTNSSSLPSRGDTPGRTEPD